MERGEPGLLTLSKGVSVRERGGERAGSEEGPDPANPLGRRRSVRLENLVSWAQILTLALPFTNWLGY